MKKLNKYIGVCLLAIALSSCHKDLDLKPTNDVTADVAYSDFKGYTSSFARLYGSLTLTSTSGPNNSDLGGLDPVHRIFTPLLERTGTYNR
jgi:hypothetical protein